MNVKIKYLRQLLQKLNEKTGEAIDKNGLLIIGSQIDGIGDDYIYKKIFLEINNEEDGEGELGLRDSTFNLILKSLGFNNLKAFIESLAPEIDAQLASCEGSYYCYVRSNAEKGQLFRSPVRMWIEGNQLRFELKGPRLFYHAILELRHGCLFIPMKSEEGKAFYHVYKMGTRKHPHVLQGTFSGVSTAFDPIGGRTVLIRADSLYSELTNDSLDVVKLEKSEALAERRLSVYFRDYANNNVSPNKSYSFDLSDLGDCE